MNKYNLHEILPISKRSSLRASFNRWRIIMTGYKSVKDDGEGHIGFTSRWAVGVYKGVYRMQAKDASRYGNGQH
jgi:hypothetical protein